ncbi:hypothetical protein BVC93_23700 [Mycobacterium sp. MS1601]|uniref:amidase n=1 Tax=Mycobacterium sp. MS1601 TaxID=1936029 RepID=UPI0009797068|nr:amidase [Mycobacterium sp. MS1601]AQA04915.1 hypothetical protein BVC93_23700 [Mycobacterium sp. MS1601]
MIDTDISTLIAAYRSGEATPTAVLEDTLSRIDERNPAINALAYVDADAAAAAAAASTQRWAAGTPLSAMDGVPVTIKDSVNASGMPWRHGCAAFDDVPDSTVDAPPAARLKEAGAVILGKTTMPDFGMMAAGVSSLYGITRNPWDLTRSTGGSSSGAGASLAAGIGFGSVGTDIAGSVRLPAGHCGLVALKPTQGRIPHLAPSTMRSAGPMARTVDDAIALYDILSRPDVRDLWSLAPEDGATSTEPLSPSGLRIGVLTELNPGFAADTCVAAVVDAAAAALADGGAMVTTMAPVFDDDPYPALDRVFAVRAIAELESIPEDRRHLVHPAIRTWCASAAAYTAADFTRDSEAVAHSAETMRAACAEFDFVIAPVIPMVGFAADVCGGDESQPLAHCGFTAWSNQTAAPASALCFGFSGGMPVGIQVIGPRLADRAVLRLTKWLESRRGFDIEWPHPVTAQAGGTT